MKAVAPAILYALFVWWFATGLVLLLVLRRKQAVSAALAGAALLFPVALYVLARSGTATGIAGAYLAFTAAIVLWGTQEITFLTGLVTGPRSGACPSGVHGYQRFRYALGAILYHEIALLASGAAVLAATWRAPNQVGALTFLVLWVMRISAKLNLFLGVPVLNDDLLPRQIDHLRSYFLRGPVNPFFPVAAGLSVLAMGGLVNAAWQPEASTAETAGYILVATLMALAILEHVFMLVPLPVDRLWRWSKGGTVGAPTSRTTDAHGGNEIERIAITSP